MEEAWVQPWLIELLAELGMEMVLWGKGALPADLILAVSPLGRLSPQQRLCAPADRSPGGLYRAVGLGGCLAAKAGEGHGRVAS